MSQMPMGAPPIHGGVVLRPHRGVAVLVLGILGLVLGIGCAISTGIGVIVGLIFGIIAWVMGSSDLNAMNAGRMDPSGYGLTQAGKICGMISAIISIIILGIVLVLLVVGIGAAVASGAAGTP